MDGLKFGLGVRVCVQFLWSRVQRKIVHGCNHAICHKNRENLLLLLLLYQ